LLSLLNLKQTGVNPGTLLETVGPVMDLTPFYLTDRYTTEITLGAITTAAIATAASGTSPLFTVGGVNFGPPNGHLWYVIDLTAIAAIPTPADTIKFSVVTFDGLAAGNGPHERTSTSQDVISARARAASCRADRPFFLAGGALFSCRVHDVLSAGGITVTMAITVVDMLI